MGNIYYIGIHIQSTMVSMNVHVRIHYYLSYTLTLQPNIEIMYVYLYFQTLKTTLLVQEGST